MTKIGGFHFVFVTLSPRKIFLIKSEEANPELSELLYKNHIDRINWKSSWARSMDFCWKNYNGEQGGKEGD